MEKEFKYKKSRIHKYAAFALAMVLSVTSILFTTYQNLTIKELSAAINRTQESINNATALVPDTRETDVINVDFRLILEGEMSSGADGYTEYDNGTGKTRDITPEVSVQDICRILYRAAEIYMENNPDKFTDDKIIGIVEKRQNPRLRIIQE